MLEDILLVAGFIFVAAVLALPPALVVRSIRLWMVGGRESKSKK